MKNQKILIILSITLISLLLTAAVPMAQSELVALTINNDSDDYVTFKLQGPRFYYLTVKPNTSTTFTIFRGDYNQKFYSCGTFVETTFDLTKKYTIYVPACGEKAFNTDKGSGNTVDAGQLIKLVKVSFENESDANLVLILRGPATYVFFIREGETETYTIAKGDYEITQYGCSTIKNLSYYSYANKVKELSCPSW